MELVLTRNMDLQKLKKNNEKKVNFFISFLCLIIFLLFTFVNKGLSQANVPELDIDVTEGVVAVSYTHLRAHETG